LTAKIFVSISNKAAVSLSLKICFRVQILLYPLAIAGKNEKITFCEKHRFICRKAQFSKNSDFQKDFN
jgi:hypothetical protein